MVSNLENIDELKEQIRKLLEEKVNPYLHIDGGDVHLVSISDDGIATVKFEGSCLNCPLKLMTLRGGIERVIMQNVPGIRRIEEE